MTHNTYDIDYHQATCSGAVVVVSVVVVVVVDAFAP
jgi:hypothetical protein